MPDRRRVIAWLGLGTAGVVAGRSARAQVPALSNAPPGAVVAPGWRHQALPNAFGGAIPRINGLAIGADTDNTADTVTAWFGDLRFLKEP